MSPDKHRARQSVDVILQTCLAKKNNMLYGFQATMWASRNPPLYFPLQYTDQPWCVTNEWVNLFYQTPWSLINILVWMILWFRNSSEYARIKSNANYRPVNLSISSRLTCSLTQYVSQDLKMMTNHGCIQNTDKNHMCCNHWWHNGCWWKKNKGLIFFRHVHLKCVW